MPKYICSSDGFTNPVSKKKPFQTYSKRAVKQTISGLFH